MTRLIKTPTILAILNGLLGDKLKKAGSSWILDMSFRKDGRSISVDNLKKLKGKKIAVFVHGLMADERIWKTLTKNVKHGFHPIHIRYNTGLHISENGKALANLLNDLDAKLAPKELSLIGHSMGGLVIRSAGYYATESGYSWTRKVRKIFLLAVPNEGASLEQVSHATSFILRKIAFFQLGLIGNILEQRSEGIKDLRLGIMLESDWTSPKQKLRDHFKRSPVPPLAGVRYYILVANLLKDNSHFMAKYFGDGLVSEGSAVAKTLVSVAEVKVFTETGHNSLLKKVEVARYLRDKLR